VEAINLMEESMQKLYILLATAAIAAPVLAQTDAASPQYVGPATVVNAQRSAEDQAITLAVIDRIAADPLISGRVGVDTVRNVVTLSGRVATPIQSDRAARHAFATKGVREVDNQLRSHPGA
jgi:osmotically-inducible protein OsmY